MVEHVYLFVCLFVCVCVCVCVCLRLLVSYSVPKYHVSGKDRKNYARVLRENILRRDD